MKLHFHHLKAIIEIKMTRNYLNRITRDQDICFGKPVIRNLRYPVDMLLSLMASGMSKEEILEDYEDLQYEDLLACLQYAAKISQSRIAQKIVL